MRDLDALASQARGYLVDKGYARSTIAHYEAAWKRLMSWCEDEGIGGYDHDVERRFIEEVVMANADATRCLGLDKSRVLLLPPVGETGEPPDGEARRRLVVPAGLDAACLAHAAGPGGRGPGAPGREGYPCGARDLCEGRGATRPGQLDARPVGVLAEAVSRRRPARPGPASHATSRASRQESGRAVPRLPRQSPISQATGTRPCHPRALRPRCRRCRGASRARCAPGATGR